MRRKPLITLLLLAYLGAWTATATLGVSKARTAAGPSDDPSSWRAISPAPFWIIGNYTTWEGGYGYGFQTHYVWLPGCAFELHARDTGWAGCCYPTI